MHILDAAQSGGYGVPAINIVNDLTMEAVLAAAVEQQSPVIVQTSVKTVRSIGAEVLWSMWSAMTEQISVPVALHLDHCPDREVISTCLRLGWTSVLFDASSLPLEENLAQTIEVVEEARRYGAHVEGEIETIKGVEDGLGSDAEPELYPLEVAVRFIKESGIDVFAPAIGNAHGHYTSLPTLDASRVEALVDATGLPMALHGGSGLSEEQFQDLIKRGCCKVNISTALKEAFMIASLEHLQVASATAKWDPPSLFNHTRDAVIEMASLHMQMFGSAGALR
jgi:fructose-bisphosphate aldolase class II